MVYICSKRQPGPSLLVFTVRIALLTILSSLSTMENEERPRSPITMQRREESLRQRRERERQHRASEPPKREIRCNRRKKGTMNVEDSSELLKPPKRERYVATDVDKAIQRDAKRCLHRSERSVYSRSLITSSAG